jgi:hypothetical protein
MVGAGVDVALHRLLALLGRADDDPARLDALLHLLERRLGDQLRPIRTNGGFGNVSRVERRLF